VPVDADLDQSVEPMIPREPLTIVFGRVIIEPPKIRIWIYRFRRLGPPHCRLDQIEHLPARLIERRAGMMPGVIHPTNPARIASRAIGIGSGMWTIRGIRGNPGQAL